MAKIVSFAYMSLQLRTIRVDMSASQLPAKSKTEAAPIAQFQRIRSSRAFDEIAAQIRTELSSGRLAVGNRLPSERALSEQFGALAIPFVRPCARSSMPV